MILGCPSLEQLLLFPLGVRNKGLVLLYRASWEVWLTHFKYKPFFNWIQIFASRKVAWDNLQLWHIVYYILSQFTVHNKLTLGFILQRDADEIGCIFIEKLDGGYLTYLSKKNAHLGWYLGFKRSGRPKPGPKTTWGQKAVQFLARRATRAGWIWTISYLNSVLEQTCEVHPSELCAWKLPTLWTLYKWLQRLIGAKRLQTEHFF